MISFLALSGTLGAWNNPYSKTSFKDDKVVIADISKGTGLSVQEIEAL